jgi:anti-sigma factor RsiW
MPDCSRIDALVTPFVDGELPDDDQRVVSTHLTACRPCRAKVAAERAVRALIQARRAELSPGAPPSLKTRCAMLHASARSNDAAPLSPGAAASAPVSPPQPSAAVPSSPAVGSSPHRRSPLGGAASMPRARLAPIALAATLLFAHGAAFL